MTSRHDPPANQPVTDDAARWTRTNESGWTLVEVLIVTALMVVVLGAVLAISDKTQQTAASDSERGSTVGDAQSGIARIASDLRNACVLFGAGGTGSPGYYCRQNFTAAPGTSACTRSSDCIDAIVDTRTSVTRPSGAATRGLLRVRIDCGTTDPASATQTQCSRYAVACTTSSCPSPTALTGVLVRSVTNFGATGVPVNVFVWCTPDTITLNAGAASCSGTPATAGAVQISLTVARKGHTPPASPGSGGSFLLQDGVELKNINQGSS